MSQKSSDPQAVKFVSLIPNTIVRRYIVPRGGRRLTDFDELNSKWEDLF